MEPDDEPTDFDIFEEPMLQLFKYKHLKNDDMRMLSRQFCVLAKMVVLRTRDSIERESCLRKLREAKDCAITALLWVKP